jgi:succinate-acetate transporter protein
MRSDDGPAHRVVRRPAGSPLPLGLAGLAIASLLVAGADLGWVATSETHTLGVLLLATAVPLQLVSCLGCLAAGDGAAAASVGLLATSWAAIAVTRLTSPPGSTSVALGLVMLAVTPLLLGAASAQLLAGKALVPAVVGAAAVRCALNGISELAGGGRWRDAAGVLGLLVVAAATYLVCAVTLADARVTSSRAAPPRPWAARRRRRRTPAAPG